MRFRGVFARTWVYGFAATAAVAVSAPAALAQFNPVVEQQNYSKTEGRQDIYTTPQYLALLTQVSQQNLQDALTIQRNDPERQF